MAGMGASPNERQLGHLRRFADGDLSDSSPATSVTRFGHAGSLTRWVHLNRTAALNDAGPTTPPRRDTATVSITVGEPRPILPTVL